MKIVFFGKGGQFSNNERWTYGGLELEIVSSFKATNTLAGKALRAMNCLFTITRYMQVPTNIVFNLFDSFDYLNFLAVCI